MSSAVAALSPSRNSIGRKERRNQENELSDAENSLDALGLEVCWPRHTGKTRLCENMHMVRNITPYVPRAYGLPLYYNPSISCFFMHDFYLDLSQPFY